VTQKRGDHERLLDILDVIKSLRTHVGSREDLDDEVTAAAATHWIEVIGEAITLLTPEVRATHSEVAWRSAIGMRNRLIHGYFDIDLNLLWDTINDDLPTLDRQVRSILSEPR
jgi:uncharacterized protein with HEPN domain